MSAKNKKTITVGVYGGLVQWIEGIPDDIRVVVQDYDVEGVEAGDLSRDAEGTACAKSVWEGRDET